MSASASLRQEKEERTALDKALDALGVGRDNTCTCVELRVRLSKSPHAVLGMHADASPEEVRAAYKRKVKQFHPDRNYGAAEPERRINKVALELVMGA